MPTEIVVPKTLEQLEKESALIRKENSMLKIALRAAAQKYFSFDKKSVENATRFYRFEKCVPSHVPITREMVVAHWMTHGGPEGFAKDFGDADSLRVHDLLHSLNDGEGNTPVEMAM